MIEQQGCVLGLDGGQALIGVGPETGCAICAEGKGCGAGIFGRLLKRRPVVLRLENRIGAGPGDVVRVGIPERLFLGLIARLYLLPLLAALAGAAFGHHVGEMVSAKGWWLDASALAGALTGLLLTLPRPRLENEHMAHAAVRLLQPAEGTERAGCRVRGNGPAVCWRAASADRRRTVHRK